MNELHRHEIKDEDWERIRHFFPERTEHTMGRPRKDPQMMLNGILWIQVTGAPWRDLPPDRYGAWQTVYKTFARWDREGLYKKIFAELIKDADMQDISIDATYIKAHRDSAWAGKKIDDGVYEEMRELTKNQCIGISRGGRSTKIHAVVDGLGNPLKVMLTSGEVHDSMAAVPLLEQIDLEGTVVLGDKGYSTKKIRKYITDRNAVCCIPSKSNEIEKHDIDKEKYKERALVENFWLKIKQYRRIAMRFEKLAARFLAFIHIACILLWLK